MRRHCKGLLLEGMIMLTVLKSGKNKAFTMHNINNSLLQVVGMAVGLDSL